MKKVFFYLGVSVLFLGLIVVIASSVMRNVQKVKVDSIQNSWELPVNLTKRNIYIVDIFSSTKWRDDYTGGYYEDPQPVDVVIKSPNGNETKLKAYFVARLSDSPYYMSSFPSLVYVEYLNVDSDNLDVDEDYPQIRLIAKQEGVYTVRIVEETLGWTSGPPREIVLYQEVIESSFPLITASGGALLLVGVVLSAFGLRVSKKKATAKKSIHRRGK